MVIDQKYINEVLDLMKADTETRFVLDIKINRYHIDLVWEWLERLELKAYKQRVDWFDLKHGNIDVLKVAAERGNKELRLDYGL